MTPHPKRHAAAAAVGGSALVLAAIAFWLFRPPPPSAEAPAPDLRTVAAPAPLPPAYPPHPSQSSPETVQTHPPAATPAPAATRTSPQEFASTLFQHGVSYAHVRQQLRPDDLPTLHRLLEDPAFADRWQTVATTIAYLSNRGDTASAAALLNYVRRPADWAPLPESRRPTAVLGRLRAVAWTGLVGTGQTDAALRQALSEEGAAALGKNWLTAQLPAPWDKRPEKLVGLIRGYAAIGLVYSQEPDNIRHAEQAYATKRQQVKTTDAGDDHLYALIDAMAERDLIAAIGLEKRLMLSGSIDGGSAVFDPYIRKYLNP